MIDLNHTVGLLAEDPHFQFLAAAGNEGNFNGEAGQAVAHLIHQLQQQIEALKEWNRRWLYQIAEETLFLPLTFKVNEAELEDSVEIKQQVLKIAAFLRSHEEIQLGIEGRTDSQGNSNERLAERRAEHIASRSLQSRD